MVEKTENAKAQQAPAPKKEEEFVRDLGYEPTEEDYERARTVGIAKSLPPGARRQ